MAICGGLFQAVKGIYKFILGGPDDEDIDECDQQDDIQISDSDTTDEVSVDM